MTSLDPVASRHTPRAGDRRGPYRLLEPLGAGGVGLVFRAINELTGEVVALKSASSPREGQLASIRREMMALEKLRHPGVIRIREGGVFEGVPWYAMDLLQGETLRSLLKWRAISGIRPTEFRSNDDGPVYTAETVPNTQNLGNELESGSPSSGPTSGVGPVHEPTWLVTLVRRVCEPLAYVHGEGIVHRDLTPGNIFVLPDGRPVVMDFGLVWRLEGDGSRGVVSVDAARAGTLPYMAPEQARGDSLDARSDLFSLGCIMYEALAGLLPFPAQSLAELLALHAEGPPPSPATIAPGVPRLLSDLVMGLLEIQPQDRIGHASTVAAVLDDLGARMEADAGAVAPKAYLYRPRLVGRERRLARVLDQVGTLEAGQGSFVLVGGESGIGKTSFASEVARLSGLRGIRVVSCACDAVGVSGGRGERRGGPLYPFRSLLQAVADRCVAGGEIRTRKLLGNRAKTLAVVEPTLAELPGVPGGPDPMEVPSDAARRRLLDALAETLAEFATERRVLLVLEDLQWADDVSLAFLSSLSATFFATHPVMILGTHRSDEVSSDLESILGLGHVECIRLDRLSADAVRAMASEMLAQRTIPEHLAAFLTEESSGHPYFVSEYLRAAVDAGLLFRDRRGRWQEAGSTPALGGLSLPRTLRAVVERRLSSLPESTRGVAESAAVLGRDVEIQLLCALCVQSGTAVDDEAFEASLRDLTTRDVLEPSSEGSVRFVHDTLREVSYERLSLPKRTQLHAACAELLERHHRDADTLGGVSAALALHFERAGADRKALGYFDKAGESAHSLHANQEAFRLLSRAKALDEKLGRPTSRLARARRERMLGLNALALGDINGAFSALTEATRVAGRPWPSTRPRMMLRCASELLREVGQRWIEREAALPGDDRELLLEAARAYERLFAVNFFSADMLGVMVAGLTNMSLAARAGGATGELALGYATFGAMCALSTLDRTGQSYCARAMQVARDSGDEIAETWVLMNVAVVHLQAARWTPMQACLESVRTTARRVGFSRRWEEATTQFSTARLLAGRLSEAEQLNDELLGGLERADPQSKCWAVVRTAELALLRGDPARALDASLEGERWCRAGLGRGEWVYTLGPLALAHLRSGDHEAAKGAADACGEWIDKGSAPLFYNVFAYAASAEVYVTLWEHASNATTKSRLAASVRRSVRRLRAIARAMPIARPAALLWRGIELAKLSAKRERARGCFEAAVERASALGMAYDRALALAALGEYGGGTRRQTAAWFSEAGSVFAECGATHDAARIERLQHQLGAS